MCFLGDEGKPSCTSCQTRGVQCAYPDMLFIPRIGAEVPLSQANYDRIRVCMFLGKKENSILHVGKGGSDEKEKVCRAKKKEKRKGGGGGIDKDKRALTPSPVCP